MLIPEPGNTEQCGWRYLPTPPFHCRLPGDDQISLLSDHIDRDVPHVPHVEVMHGDQQLQVVQALGDLGSYIIWCNQHASGVSWNLTCDYQFMTHLVRIPVSGRGG